MSKLRITSYTKHIVIIIILTIFCEWLSWNLSYVSLIERAPDWFRQYLLTFEVVQPWYEGSYFSTGFYIWMYFDARFICFLIMIVLSIITNLTLRYKTRQSFWKNKKWFIIVPSIVILVEFTFMLVFSIFGFVSISIVGWYILLNTIFEPIPMFKKKSTPITSAV